MDTITVSRLDDPSQTRVVSEASFRRWPAGRVPGSKAGGAHDWAQVTEDRPVAPRAPRVPEIIERVMAKPEGDSFVAGDAMSPSPTIELAPDEPITAANLVSLIHEAETIEEVDALVGSDERKTVLTASDKRKAQLARQ